MSHHWKAKSEWKIAIEDVKTWHPDEIFGSTYHIVFIH